MSSEVIREITLGSGNTGTRQRGSGHSAVARTLPASRHGAGIMRYEYRDEGRGKPSGVGV